MQPETFFRHVDDLLPDIRGLVGLCEQADEKTRTFLARTRVLSQPKNVLRLLIQFKSERAPTRQGTRGNQHPEPT